MPNAADERAFRKKLGFKPNRRLPWSRFDKPWSKGLLWAWYWRMRGMGREHNSALSSPNSDCSMQWALSRTPQSGNRDNRWRRRHEDQVGVRPPSVCSAMRNIFLRPFDQKPFFRIGLGALVVAMRRTHADCGESR